MQADPKSKLNPSDLWLGKPAPRYTSYPPAPQFHAGVNRKDYRHTLMSMPQKTSVSVYIHIPFCRQLCLYCGCNTSVTNQPTRINTYIDALKSEIGMVTELTGRRQVTSVHFGGGTPNILTATQMHDIFECLHKNFDLNATGEIAMEMDPRVATPDQAALLASCGVNRVSLGVQDFDAAVQTAINRVQPYYMVERLCDSLREAGITHINFDLLYGLPLQTVETMIRSCRMATQLQPDRIALFSYAHVPQMKKHQVALEKYPLPDKYERLDMDVAARGILMSRGYEAIGIDHFTLHNDPMALAWRQGKLHRGFQGYTTEENPTLLGFGASSISQTQDGYFQNERDARDYKAQIALGELPACRGVLLTQHDRVRRAIIEQLMCRLSCDVAAICAQYDYPVQAFDIAFERLKPYHDARLVSRNGYALCLTTPHRMAIRVICSLFDAYIPSSTTAMSRTA